MDYVVGSIAALLTGNVTPNRPRQVRNAQTPMKHQPSPNVTPKSEFVEDRSIFLSPTMQKKKAFVKKSPKRIFQNPDEDVTIGDENDSSLVSPKVEKVKKHLKGDLEADSLGPTILLSPKSLKNSEVSPKKGAKRLCGNISVEKNSTFNKKKRKSENGEEVGTVQNGEYIKNIESIESSPKKKFKKMDSSIIIESSGEHKSSKKKNKKSNEFIVEEINSTEVSDKVNSNNTSVIENQSPKKNKNKKKNKDKQNGNVEGETTDTNEKEKNLETKEVNTNSAVTESQAPAKKKKKRKGKKKSKQNEQTASQNTANTTTVPKEDPDDEMITEDVPTTDNQSQKKKKNKSKKNKIKDLDESGGNETVKVNPNAVTNEDTDSEHESDDEIDSENEEVNKKAFDSAPANVSSDEAEENGTKNKQEVKKFDQKFSQEEIKRELFVGNVPFSPKVKKEIKKIFSKYGNIETVRIRTVPVKDARDTPKMAVIKKDLHPERSTVNVYVKFDSPQAVQKALVENNTVLNGCHLRVHAGESAGVPEDSRCSIFVGNMPFTLEDEALRSQFQKCGDIESVRIIRDKATCYGKGFGYVNFKSKDSVELALEMTEEDLTIKNRILRVKRCTQPSDRQKKESFRRQGNNQVETSGKRFGGGRQNGNFRKNQGNEGQKFGKGKFGGHNDGKKDFRRQGQGNERGGFGKGKFGGKPEFRKKENFNRQDQGNNDGQNEEKSGAYRRIMNKRQSQDSGEGPPSKRQNVDQPPREKKERKEFVGMTAEKKKKKKFDKGLKKKKMLSEILTKV